MSHASMPFFQKINTVFPVRCLINLSLIEYHMPPRAHAHGGGDEEEIVVVRTDGPPFVDLRASPGKGFELDFERVSKYLGPGKVRTVVFRDFLSVCFGGVFPTMSSHNFL